MFASGSSDDNGIVMLLVYAFFAFGFIRMIRAISAADSGGRVKSAAKNRLLEVILGKRK